MDQFNKYKFLLALIVILIMILVFVYFNFYKTSAEIGSIDSYFVLSFNFGKIFNNVINAVEIIIQTTNAMPVKKSAVDMLREFPGYANKTLQNPFRMLSSFCLSKGLSNCAKRPGALVNDIHTESDCSSAGGEVANAGTIPGTDNYNKVCKFKNSTASADAFCPNTWTQFGQWTTTEKQTVLYRIGECRQNNECAIRSSDNICESRSHTWRDRVPNIDTINCDGDVFSYKYRNSGTLSCSLDMSDDIRRYARDLRLCGDYARAKSKVIEVGCY